MFPSGTTVAFLSLYQLPAVVPGPNPRAALLTATVAYGTSNVTFGGYLRDTNTSTTLSIQSSVIAPLNAWTHVALTVPATNSSNVTLFLNGTQVASTPVSGFGGPQYNATTGFLGGNFSVLVVGGLDTILSPGGTFPGAFADVQLYNSTLTASQVLGMASSNSSGGCAQLVLAPPPPPSPPSPPPPPSPSPPPPPPSPPPSPPPPAAVYLVSGPTCAGTGNVTTVYAIFAGASTSSGTVQPVDYNAAATLLVGKATGNFSQACAFTTTNNQFNCTGLNLTMGETCAAANTTVIGSLAQLINPHQGPASSCSYTGNLVNYSYTYYSSTYLCVSGSGTCSSSHSTYTTSPPTGVAAVVNPYDLATAQLALSYQISQYGFTNLTVPGGSWTAGAVGTSASGTCVVNGTDNVVCYGAQIPPGYGCSPYSGGGMINLETCDQLAQGTVSPAGLCQFCPPGQVSANTSLTSCVTGTPAPATPPAQCGGLQHRWSPALSAASGTSVYDVTGSGISLQLSSTSVYQPATGALQMQGMPVTPFSMTGQTVYSAPNATYSGSMSLLGMQPASGLTLVRFALDPSCPRHRIRM